ncbi:cellulose binding domain-containing protein [Streptomyces sp. NPDC013953]|uniref:cellulose binding domain-containing protein n=1 Tax=Streptomyces sp. NPDC013953 TaxID=3364868 RepID=UPI0036F75CA2
MTLENTGTSPWTGWSANRTHPGGQRVTHMWNAGHTQTGAAVTARSTAWNGSVRPGGSVTFGLTGSWSGANPAPADLACTAVP